LEKVRGSTPPCVWRTFFGEHFTPLWADPVRAWISLDQRPGHRVVYTKKKKKNRSLEEMGCERDSKIMG